MKRFTKIAQTLVYKHLVYNRVFRNHIVNTKDGPRQSLVGLIGLEGLIGLKPGEIVNFLAAFRFGVPLCFYTL